MAGLTKEQIRDRAEADLLSFIKLVAPHRVIPHFQEELIYWWTRKDAKRHQLTLLPRDHAKSTLIAYRAAWEIVKDPTVRILYISSTANLAEKQLGLIKQVLSSKIVRRYWPDLINEDEGKRETWTKTEIAVDDPRRAAEAIRDPTVFTGGLTTSLTGMHCDIAILDDVVVQENAYTEEGRDKVKSQYSLLASIEGAEAQEWTVGTRYHPDDLYGEMGQMSEDVYNEEGEIIASEPVYEIFQRVVEEDQEFLWPRQQRASDGKWFGFDISILANKKAKYLDKTQFYAQYYNDPNAREDALIKPEMFQYYERVHVKQKYGQWFVMGQRVNVVAAMDFAFSASKRSDYSAIVVAGIGSDGSIYVLDVDRFKTEYISGLYNHLYAMWQKWQFRKIRMEMTAAQATIVRELKEGYLKPNGIYLTIDEYYPTKRDGEKEERIAAVLGPRYENRIMWHYRGGGCQILEDELVMLYPPHDDVMDALTNAVAIATPPAKRMHGDGSNVHILPTRNARFGGI